MSSLAAARADNFYHPPDWDPRKKSRAEHNVGVTKKEDKWKAHPLRERAKKLGEGILTIRFEMPFNVRCTGCDNHIAKGVRYNAEKKTIGRYLSTKILSFRMLCHCEDGTSRTDRRRNPHFIEIHTDPKNAEYVVAEGAVRVAEPELCTPSELGVETALDPEEATKRQANPFYKLEASGPAAKRKPWLTELQDVRDADWADDYDANAALRRLHRSRRGEELLRGAEAEAKGLRVKLGEEHPDDAKAAASAPLQAKRRRSVVARSTARHELMSGSIFGGHGSGSGSGVAERRSAAEVERLRLLQLRRERGMKITSAPGRAPRLAPTVSAPIAKRPKLLASSASSSSSTPSTSTSSGTAPAPSCGSEPSGSSCSSCSGSAARPTSCGGGGGGGLVAYSDSDSEG
jgi:coiled-coil domain-containing protein 130